MDIKEIAFGYYQTLERTVEHWNNLKGKHSTRLPRLKCRLVRVDKTTFTIRVSTTRTTIIFNFSYSNNPKQLDLILIVKYNDKSKFIRKAIANTVKEALVCTSSSRLSKVVETNTRLLWSLITDIVFVDNLLTVGYKKVCSRINIEVITKYLLKDLVCLKQTRHCKFGLQGIHFPVWVDN